MRSSGFTWSKWFTCDRCGNDYPVRYLAHQNGLRVCTFLPCLDREIRPSNLIPSSDEPVVTDGQSNPS